MGELFQGIGLFLCVGGIIVIALIAMAVRAFTSRSRNTANNVPSVFDPDQRGNERPTYDSRRVESRGGFGAPPSNIPQTGTQNRTRARVYDTQRGINEERTPGSPLPRLNSNDTPSRPANPGTSDRPRRDRSRHDDDNVRSGGGFGS